MEKPEVGRPAGAMGPPAGLAAACGGGLLMVSGVLPKDSETCLEGRRIQKKMIVKSSGNDDGWGVLSDRENTGV